MRKLYLTTLIIATAFFCDAQNWELKINAGGNTTFVSGITGKIIYGQTPYGIAWEDLNSGQILGTIGTTNTTTKNKFGIYVDGEMMRHLPNGWGISLSAGINTMNYTYDIHLDSSDTTSMKQIDQNFGDTKLLYLSSRFLNVTKSFSNLTLSAGPVLNVLIHDNGQGKIYYHDNGNNTFNYIAAPLHKPVKFLYGGNLSVGYKLAEPLELKAGAEYFFNSVYKKGENAINEADKKVHPFQIMLGLSYSILKL